MVDHLTSLEDRSIFILREAAAAFGTVSMLWSMGKDSSALLRMVQKAFFGSVPFTLVHIDTGYKLPEMITFRDRVARELGLKLIVMKNTQALEERRSFPSGSLSRIDCCRALKTEPLRCYLQGQGTRLRLCLETGTAVEEVAVEPVQALVLGIRADEEGTRSKERYFSPRNADNAWDPAAQPPELWDLFAPGCPPGSHVRVHPLLDWTELDIWQYIEREGIEVVPAYFNQGAGTRYRSLGCGPCMSPISSTARTVPEVIAELRDGHLARIAERAGRAQDREDGGGLEQLRTGGYM